MPTRSAHSPAESSPAPRSASCTASAVSGLRPLGRLPGGDDVGVLVVTAAREADTVRAAASGGAVHYLVKPFDYDDLRVRLESFRTAHLALSGSAAPGQEDIDAVFGAARNDSSRTRRSS